MSNTKYILKQDECSPDSAESFNNSLIEIVGCSLAYFKNKGEFKADGYNFSRKLGKYVLELCQEFPYYTLRIDEGIIK